MNLFCLCIVWIEKFMIILKECSHDGLILASIIDVYGKEK